MAARQSVRAPGANTVSAAVKRLILGPQRPALTLDGAMQAAGLDDGPVAVVTAGWQEAEGDIDPIRKVLSQPIHDVGLYRLSRQLFQAEPELHNRYRQRQDRLAEQQALYRQRLRQHAIAVRRTLKASGTPAVIAPERRHAIAQLRALDRHHLRQVENAQLRFGSEFNVNSNRTLALATEKLHAELDNFPTVILAGGNLPVLLNRLRLFSLDDVLSRKHVVAWSAGAMLLGERIVLFHERMPQGLRDAEILDRGFGLLAKTIVMPDATNRLRTGNTLRMSAMSRRFSPATCCLLNNGSSVLFVNNVPVHAHDARYPATNGKLKAVAVS